MPEFNAKQADNRMKLSEIFAPELVRAPLKAADKTGAITELVDVLSETGRLTDRDEVLRAVLDREGTRSTGIGNGLAVPHGKCAGCPKLVMAVGRPETPIEFGSTDGKPVRLIVLLASPPDETGPHIQALARISRLMLMEEFRRDVLAAGSPQEIYDLILKYEH
ncbi:MAG: PTS sugar transporter subunit IIA [Phycisphaerales bacterium]|nr:PTS sugar transporter subunit IIA [Phycisphaerales bacterium]